MTLRTTACLHRMAAAALGLATATATVFTPSTALAQGVTGHPDWPGKGQLFVGTCYQPIDRSPAQIASDIAVMKAAGFTMVRMGDLSWDSFEPEEGKFTFDWFDKVLDQMHAAGIRVILDIPGQPAPIWLHKHYPGVDIVNQQGDRVHAASRYYDNISDPDYRRLVRRLATTMLQRYAKHPAMIAVGYDNEIGNGRMSYSESDRLRFVDWLKARYGSLDALNKAWATQRWSRRIGDWSQVDLPYQEGPGPNERNLDLHRYWSDDSIAALKELESVRKQYAPDLPAVSNLFPYSGTKDFDWLRSYDKISTYGAQGLYPSDPLGAAFEVMLNKAGHETPFWFNEFTAGGFGYYGTPGRSRMWAYFGLLSGAQTVLAWTFNSHLGGEEQMVMGLVDHDDRPSWKVKEFGQIASEFAKLQTMGFPRMLRPEVAIGFSFQTHWLTSPPAGPNSMRDFFRPSYWDQAKAAYAPLFADNVDTAVVDIGNSDISRYKLIVLPAAYMMDKQSADALRRYVAAGGTVIMTGLSAKADETGKWFDTPLPGRLTDVFGLRTNEFYRAEQPLKMSFQGKMLTGNDSYYEVLEPGTAEVVARFTGQPNGSPAITVNRFGKGRAYYLATGAQGAFLDPLVRAVYEDLGIARGPQTPDGVRARTVDGRTMYVNVNTAPATITLAKPGRDALTGKSYSRGLTLPGYGVALIE